MKSSCSTDVEQCDSEGSRESKHSEGASLLQSANSVNDDR